MLWNVENKGFLPSCDPIMQLPVSNYKNTQLVFALENLTHMMPCFLSERRWREEVVYELRSVMSKFGNVLVDKFSSPAELERAFLLFGMFANGYLFSAGDTHMQRLPKEIALPLTELAKACGRRPVLDYTSYVLYNWQRYEDGRIEPLVTFTDTATEKKIIEAFVRHSFDVAGMINSRKADSPVVYMSKWKTTLENIVLRMCNLRKDVNSKEFDLLGEYYNNQGECECNPFAQAPWFSVLYKVFSAVDKDPLLQKAETDICEYRPTAHNQFIANVNSMSGLVVDEATLELYNDCLELFIDLHRSMFMVKSRDCCNVPRITALKKCVKTGV